MRQLHAAFLFFSSACAPAAVQDTRVPAGLGDPALDTGVFEEDPDHDEPVEPFAEPVTLRVQWVTIEGGSFDMGSRDLVGYRDERPRHTVNLPSFELARTETTTAHYRICVATGACTSNEDPNPAHQGRAWAWHPITHIDWHQARTFCAWVGGRLPTEAEWEYAARSRGQDIVYPWGSEEPSCERAITDEGGRGCGKRDTWPVCSKPAGNSAEGLCDLAGNVYEWVEDWYQSSYAVRLDGERHEAPQDGSAWLGPDQLFRVMRGGGISSESDYRASFRQFHSPDFHYGGLGVRCARDLDL